MENQMQIFIMAAARKRQEKTIHGGESRSNAYFLWRKLP